MMGSYHSHFSGGSGRGVNDRYWKKMVVPMLTSHPLVPYAMASMVLFEGGFLIDRLDEMHCLPMLVSFALHVDRAWVVSMQECLDHCTRYVQTQQPPTSATMSVGGQRLPFLQNVQLDGIVMVFRLRTFGMGKDEESVAESEIARQEMMEFLQTVFLDEENNGFRSSFLHNPAAHALPFTSAKETRFIALLFPSEEDTQDFTFSVNTSFGQLTSAPAAPAPASAKSKTPVKGPEVSYLYNTTATNPYAYQRSAGSLPDSSGPIALNAMVGVWKQEFESLNIPCYRGTAQVSLPDEILLSFAMGLDTWKLLQSNDVYNAMIRVPNQGKGLPVVNTRKQHMLQVILSSVNLLVDCPARGYLPLK